MADFLSMTGVLGLIVAAFVSIIVADVVFSLLVNIVEYTRYRVLFEAYMSEFRELRSQGGEKRVERRLRKLLPKLEEARRRSSRYAFYRLLILLPLYIGVAITSFRLPILLPDPCCTPIVSIGLEELCGIAAPILVALAYIMFLPLVQESLLMMLILKKPQFLDALRER